MKNSILSLCCAFALSSSLSAQSQAYTKGTNIISGGLGFEGVTGNGAFNVVYQSRTPEHNLQYERGLWKAGSGVISLGVLIGEASYQDNVIYPGDTRPTVEKTTYWELGLRGAYHFTGLKVPNLDTYAGIETSQTRTHFTDGGPSSLTSNGRGLSFFAGARYYLWSHLAIYGELATAPFFNAGLATKF